MRNVLSAALLLPLLVGCAQPSQSTAGGPDSAGTPTTAPSQGAGQVTVELVPGQAGSSTGQDQAATAEGAAGGAVVRGVARTPTPCHRLTGAVERAGEAVTLRVSAAADPDAMCIQSIGAIPYTATVRGLPAGAYALRVVHTYPGTGWDTETVLETRVTAR
ncbi:hypothetical protein [Longimicrobium sp.]|uniref:hypothetical protein n=1 Tax=Longimicrobium sp. TaxID=2029185 RepID=UPI002E342BE8|nr:hypothetical protein [Longimicrobium sp.]HEX6040171.1 hypothetical protein [Longimicrobium sp.]